MGQKSNPNSFNLSSNRFLFLNTFVKNNEYKFLLHEQLSFIDCFVYFFEKQTNSLVNKSFYFIDNKNQNLYFFISFLADTSSNQSSISVVEENNLLVARLTSVLDSMGYKTLKKTYIFQNLNNISEPKSFIKEISFFKNEKFHNMGLVLLNSLKKINRVEVLLSKYISKYMRLYHRSKKLNIFLNFLEKFISYSIKNKLVSGLKVQIKGRFNGASRSKTRIFNAGSIPTQTIKESVCYDFKHIYTSYGVFGLKIWICKNKKN